jgi:hypothetical protein
VHTSKDAFQACGPAKRSVRSVEERANTASPASKVARPKAAKASRLERTPVMAATGAQRGAAAVTLSERTRYLKLTALGQYGSVGLGELLRIIGARSSTAGGAGHGVRQEPGGSSAVGSKPEAALSPVDAQRARALKNQKRGSRVHGFVPCVHGRVSGIRCSHHGALVGSSSDTDKRRLLEPQSRCPP